MKNIYMRFLWTILLSILFIPCFSQETKVTARDIDFAFYLLEGRKFDEVVMLLNHKHNQQEIEWKNTQQDSVDYILGMTYYYQKELEKSAYHLSNVSISSPFYTKSTFFSALDYAHLGAYSKSQTIIEKYTEIDSNYSELVTLELAGLALLNRDFATFDRHAKDFRFDQYYYANSEAQLMNVRKTLGNYKKKSPFMAGFLSTVVPGLGKVYTGHIGEGVASFLTVGSLAAITAENWAKNGIVDWKTITFGTLFSVFYIGNIYGSVATVKVYRMQFNEKQNNIILLGIHIPIRTLFE